MLQKVEPLTISDFNKGLYTNISFIKNEKGQSPNTMNVKWNADGSLQKRYGSTTQNTIQIGSASVAGWTLETGTGLTLDLQGYWKLNETANERADERGTNALNLTGSVTSESGIRGLAALFQRANTGFLHTASGQTLTTTSSFTISTCIYLKSMASYYQGIMGRRVDGATQREYIMYVSGINNTVVFAVSSSGTTDD